MGKNKAAPALPRIRHNVVFRFNPRSRCNSNSRCCYRAREHVDPAWSRGIRHGGDSHPEMPSSPGSVVLARAHPLTKTQAMEPSRQTWSSYGPPYPLGRWSSRLAVPACCIPVYYIIHTRGTIHFFRKVAVNNCITSQSLASRITQQTWPDTAWYIAVPPCPVPKRLVWHCPRWW